jgi:branched-chain amino acid transport system ATP-binding protein
LFEGDDIMAMPAEMRVKRGIAQVPEGRQICGGLTVEDNLNLGGWLHGGDKRHLQAGGLPGGQQQMLATGRELMSRPRLLLFDEPSMGLAPVLVEQAFIVIESLRDSGLTILLVEHNAAAALAKSDFGYVIETGYLSHFGPSKELISDPKLREAYLGI